MQADKALKLEAQAASKHPAQLVQLQEGHLALDVWRTICSAGLSRHCFGKRYLHGHCASLAAILTFSWAGRLEPRRAMAESTAGWLSMSLLAAWPGSPQCVAGICDSACSAGMMSSSADIGNSWPDPELTGLLWLCALTQVQAASGTMPCC